MSYSCNNNHDFNTLHECITCGGKEGNMILDNSKTCSGNHEFNSFQQCITCGADVLCALCSKLEYELCCGSCGVAICEECCGENCKFTDCLNEDCDAYICNACTDKWAECIICHFNFCNEHMSTLITNQRVCNYCYENNEEVDVLEADFAKLQYRLQLNKTKL